MEDEAQFWEQFYEALNRYAPISRDEFALLKPYLKLRVTPKGEMLQDNYTPANAIYFICKGLLRTYYLHEQSTIYTKNLFMENYFSASVVSLLTGENSYMCIQALEPSILIEINYKGYRHLIDTTEAFKNFYICYLEKNWIIEKEQNEISLIIDNATTRYQNFLKKFPDIEKRVSQHHIATHLGITPTQLSRIRKSLNIGK
ncbi:Crp/Fnr family transcriptional regulator [Sulfurospirillum arsenophilum]|uniref:Crp/Fnr family transcriptional regulator n=1 Tax=Sulfurospirillum arsenophilum TaxID=56698 RepID=UPI0005A7AC68|nr:Crp/Fnr family transcriptional regulator [Sulfurospirillum arsenophilum]